MEKGEARVSEPPSNTKEKENERLKEEKELRWELERMMKAPTDGSEYVIYTMNIVLLIYWYIFMQRHYMFTKTVQTELLCAKRISVNLNPLLLENRYVGCFGALRKAIPLCTLLTLQKIKIKMWKESFIKSKSDECEVENIKHFSVIGVWLLAVDVGALFVSLLHSELSL